MAAAATVAGLAGCTHNNPGGPSAGPATTVPTGGSATSSTTRPVVIPAVQPPLGAAQLRGALSGLPVLQPFRATGQGDAALHEPIPCAGKDAGTAVGTAHWAEYEDANAAGQDVVVELQAAQLPSPAAAARFVADFAGYVSKCSQDPLLPLKATVTSMQLTRPAGVKNLFASQFRLSAKVWQEVVMADGRSVLVAFVSHNGDNATTPNPGGTAQLIEQFTAKFDSVVSAAAP